MTVGSSAARMSDGSGFREEFRDDRARDGWGSWPSKPTTINPNRMRPHRAKQGSPRRLNRQTSGVESNVHHFALRAPVLL